MPVGCTERSEAFRGCRLVGRVRLVTTSCSPQAERYCDASRSRKRATSGRAYGNDTAWSAKSRFGSTRTNHPCSTKKRTCWAVSMYVKSWARAMRFCTSSDAAEPRSDWAWTPEGAIKVRDSAAVAHPRRALVVARIEVIAPIDPKVGGSAFVASRGGLHL